jgi:hypothetical protein
MSRSFLLGKSSRRWIVTVWATTLLLGWQPLVSSARAQDEPEPTNQDAAKAARFAEHLEKLTAPVGRPDDPHTPPEGHPAAMYLVEQFKAIGLEPAGEDGSYLQKVELRHPSELLPVTAFEVEGVDVETRLGSDFVPFGFSQRGPFAGEVVFVGYGIADAQKNHDDYANIDVRGKVVLMLRREPNGWKGNGYTPAALFRTKVAQAEKRGAAAVLIANQDPGPGGVDQLMFFYDIPERYGLPALHISRELAGKLLAAGGLPDLVSLQRKLDTGRGPVSAPLLNVKVGGQVVCTLDTIGTYNVLGKLPGEGDHADEWVLLAARFDEGAMAYPKADLTRRSDDASGLAALIETARDLAGREERKRTILFAAFAESVDEPGGTTAFVEEPPLPLDSVAVGVGVDRIARLRSLRHRAFLGLSVAGMDTGHGLSRLVRESAQTKDITFRPTMSLAGHRFIFGLHSLGVPCVVFSGMSGPVAPVNPETAAEVTGLVADVVLELANLEQAPRYRSAAAAGLQNWPRVAVGFIPSHGDDPTQVGWGVARVLPGLGAAEAGMQSGDVILSIDGEPIRGGRDLRRVLVKKVPGQKISVTVKRGEQELVLDVELTERK